MVRMAEVARALGVSVQTVSAVLNDKSGISDDTRQRVRAAVASMGYQPNEQARSLRGVRSRIIGVMIPSITNPFFPEFVQGIEDAARAVGHAILLCNVGHDLDLLGEHLSVLEAYRASGIICSVHTGSGEEQAAFARRMRKLAKNGVSVVLNGSSDGVHAHSLETDSGDAIAAAAEHLVGLGHSRIGMIAPPAGLGVSVERVGLFQAAFSSLSTPLDPALIEPGDFTIEAGAIAARALMRRPVPPTAIVAANDVAAFGAIAALLDMGLRVPEDVSVLGFDDISFARIFHPPLSTIAQPVYELGREALRLALTPPTAGTIQTARMTATFVARRSTGRVLAPN